MGEHNFLSMQGQVRKFFQMLWWRYWPGVKVKLCWPEEKEFVVDHNDPRWYDVGSVWVSFRSVDPNDHYRPWLEEHVGRQDWDWGWTMEDNDAADNLLTLKVCKSKSKYATIAALQWSR